MCPLLLSSIMTACFLQILKISNAESLEESLQKALTK